MTDDLDILSQLDAELAKVSKKSALETERLRLSKKLQDKRIGSEQRTTLRAQLTSVAAELDLIRWRIISAVALFTTQQCDNCGSTHRVFLQFMEEQRTIRAPFVYRYVRVAKPTADLPTKVLNQLKTTHICADCCSDFDYNLNDATLILGHIEQLNIAANYEPASLYGELEEVQ